MSKEIDWGQWLSPDASTTLWQQMGLVMRLSVPAILAEVSSIAMQYIDSAMVGSLGARAPPPSAWFPAPPLASAECAWR